MAHDQKYEAWLDSLNIPWKFVEKLPLSSINVRKSRANQARFGRAVDSDRAESMAIAMLDGVDFPAVVVWEDADGQFVLASGNHRDEAARAIDAPCLDAYVLRTADTAQIELVTRFANSIEGEADSPQDRVRHAAYLFRTYPGKYTLKFLARWALVKENAISRALRVEEGRERLLKLGENPDGLIDYVLERSGAIQLDSVALAAAEAFRATRMGTDTFSALVSEINRRRAPDEQLAAVAEFRQRSAEEAAAVRGRSAKKDSKRRTLQKWMRLRGYLYKAERLIAAHPSLEKLGATTAAARQSLAADWGKLAGAMGALLGRKK